VTAERLPERGERRQRPRLHRNARARRTATPPATVPSGGARTNPKPDSHRDDLRSGVELSETGPQISDGNRLANVTELRSNSQSRRLVKAPQHLKAPMRQRFFITGFSPGTSWPCACRRMSLASATRKVRSVSETVRARPFVAGICKLRAPLVTPA
jgi:hypothetical protein